MSTEFIELAGKVNQAMPYFCLEKIERALNDAGKAVRGAKVLVVGVAYKAGTSDMRESPALKIIDLLRRPAATSATTTRSSRRLPQHGLRSVEPRRGVRPRGHRHRPPGRRPRGDRARGARRARSPRRDAQAASDTSSSSERRRVRGTYERYARSARKSARGSADNVGNRAIRDEAATRMLALAGTHSHRGDVLDMDAAPVWWLERMVAAVSSPSACTASTSSRTECGAPPSAFQQLCCRPRMCGRSPSKMAVLLQVSLLLVLSSLDDRYSMRGTWRGAVRHRPRRGDVIWSAGPQPTQPPPRTTFPGARLRVLGAPTARVTLTLSSGSRTAAAAARSVLAAGVASHPLGRTGSPFTARRLDGAALESERRATSPPPHPRGAAPREVAVPRHDLVCTVGARIDRERRLRDALGLAELDEPCTDRRATRTDRQTRPSARADELSVRDPQVAAVRRRGQRCPPDVDLLAWRHQSEPEPTRQDRDRARASAGVAERAPVGQSVFRFPTTGAPSSKGRQARPAATERGGSAGSISASDTIWRSMRDWAKNPSASALPAAAIRVRSASSRRIRSTSTTAPAVSPCPPQSHRSSNGERSAAAPSTGPP